MMEHNNVEDVILTISENRIEITGRVDLMGSDCEFHIEWTMQ